MKLCSWMRRALATLVLVFIASNALAAPVTSVTLSPDEPTLIDEEATDTVSRYEFATLEASGTTYRATVAAPVKPSVVVGKNIKITGYQYSNGTLTLDFTYVGWAVGGQDGLFALTFGTPTGDELGLSDQVLSYLGGTYISFSGYDGTLEYPSTFEPGLGLSILAEQGANLFFEMFVPSAIVELLQVFSAETGTTLQDLVLTVDNLVPADITLTEVEGGMKLAVEVTIPPASGAKTADTTVSITITVTTEKSANGAYLNATPRRVKKGKKSTLKVRVGNCAVPKAVLSHWPKGASAFSKLAVLRLRNCAAQVIVTPSVTTMYKVTAASHEAARATVVVR